MPATLCPPSSDWRCAPQVILSDEQHEALDALSPSLRVTGWSESFAALILRAVDRCRYLLYQDGTVHAFDYRDRLSWNDDDGKE